MVYSYMKLTGDSAETRTCQGVIAYSPRVAQIYCPRRVLIYLGRSAEKSVATEMDFAEISKPMDAVRNPSAQKNAALSRPSFETSAKFNCLSLLNDYQD